LKDQKKIVRKPLKDLNQKGTAVNKAAEVADSGCSNGLSSLNIMRKREYGNFLMLILLLHQVITKNIIV